MSINLELRHMDLKYLPYVADNDSVCYGEHSWSEMEFMEMISPKTKVWGLVFEIEREIVGHMLYYLGKDFIEIIRLAVVPVHRRRGIGTFAICHMIDKLAYQRRIGLRFRLMEENLEGQIFLREMGFKAVRILRGYYKEQDGYLFERVVKTEKLVPMDSEQINQIS